MLQRASSARHQGSDPFRVAGIMALGMALVLAAAAFGSPSLYVPGVALILLVCAALVWVGLAGARASLERRPGPGTVEEGQGWPLAIIARAGIVPAPGGDLREPLLRGALPMAGRTQRRVQVNVTFERRGRRLLDPATLTIADPLGLVERRLHAGAGQEVLVLPRIEPVRASGSGAAARAGPPAAARPAETAAEVEMESLRPYREGAPASRIHWPTVARTGTLMERRLLADADSRPLVVLDPTGAASDEDLDKAVRAAASLTVHLARAGGCALLLPGDRRATDLGPDLAGWPPLHARLALVEEGSARLALRAQSRRGAIYWVTAARLGGAPRAVARFHGECHLVLPGAPEGRASFMVAGCAGIPIGRAERRAA